MEEESLTGLISQKQLNKVFLYSTPIEKLRSKVIL